ncbi:MAG: protocatechuate 3,4-dioxygenase [Proteobacteria bacterium]|nr:protocatechuate 3,4-dioxygenase [Pseudomonadota bacterium]
MAISRRIALQGLAGVLMMPVAEAGHLSPTPQETLGPYYPVRVPAAHEFDLTHVPNGAGRAAGQIIEISGRVLGVNGAPIPDVKIELWQANAAGRYSNPVDKNPAALDPNFVGVALLTSSVDGSYRVRTIKPGPYPDPAGGQRAPHIHFDLTAGDYRLATQMYFPGEALNDTDFLRSTMSARHRDPELVTCKRVSSGNSDAQLFEWDIVVLRS